MWRNIFHHKAKASIDELVGNLLKAYSQSIDYLDWMSPITKTEAAGKAAQDQCEDWLSKPMARLQPSWAISPH